MFIHAWKACFIVAFVQVLCNVALDATRVTYSGSLGNDSIPASEIAALQDLYDATDGVNWVWSDDPGIPWNFTNNPQPCRDNWQGVGCNYTDPTSELHIVKIFLTSHNLHGTIPETIGNLSFVEVLVLDENSLRGTIPDSIGNSMTYLKYLSFDKNKLEGFVPSSLGKLAELEDLYIESNHLFGHIPSSFAGLTMLKSLAVSHNHMSGPIPDFLGASMKRMAFLDFENNAFTGTLPSSLCEMKDLGALAVDTNQLDGSIPSCLGILTNLTTLYLYNNQLTGTIPPELGQLPLLQSLAAYNNRLHGSLPVTLANLSALRQLSVNENELTGSVPSEMGQLKLLELFWINSNRLQGTLPASLFSMHTLTEVLANNNFFTGQIPSNIASTSVHLQQLTLNNNFLTGPIPELIGTLRSLQLLYLNYNRLTGTIPSSFKGLIAVEELYLQSNQLIGSIDGVFNRSTQTKLAIVQLGYNSLEGTLPPEAFLLPQLTTFVAVSNCFTGTLPDAICNNHLMSSLILDGVQTAPSCRSRLLPHTPSQSYVVPNNFQGTIPACFFTMSSLSSLHLSGNGLKGTLPDVAAVGTRLIDLTVSYNALTGTIPHAFQVVEWKNLDLSYNRLTGYLIKEFGTRSRDLSFVLGHSTYNASNTTYGSLLDLQNNRLSGHVPTTLLHLHNISVLGTNLFTCRVDKSDLPVHDQNRDNYECDSDNFNIPFYVWLGLVVIACAAIAIGLNYGNLAARFPRINRAMDWMQKWTLEDAVMPRNFRYVCAVADILCKIALWCTALILIVLVPWYAAASHYFGTYYQQYAWTISAAFLSGSKVIGFEIFAYLSLMLFLVGSIGYLILQYDRAQARNRGSTRTISLQVGKRPPRPPLRRRVFVYTLYFLVNLFVVAGFNVAFVLVALYRSNTLLLIAQVILSFFKLSWNSVCTPLLIRYIAYRMSRSSHDTAFVTVQVVIALFNNIALPCLVVAVVSPSCFYSVFQPPSSVDSLVVYETCAVVDSSTSLCGIYVPNVLSTSYNPPFRYDYQCSSGFVTYYAPAFIYLAIAAAFVTPLLRLVGQYLFQRATPGSCFYWFLEQTVPRISLPITHVYNNRESNVFNNLSESTFSSVMSYDTLQREIFFPYFDADIFIISLITYLGILLTFGVVFPPLALAMAVTMISVSWQGKLAVGRFLYQARELNAQKFVDIIEQECRGAVTIPKIRRSIFIIICFCCSFYALFMYDTLGNDKGQMSSIWVLVFMPLFPLLIYGAIRLRRWQQGVLNLDFDLASAAAAQTEGLPMKVMRKQGGDMLPTSHSSDMLAPGNVSNTTGGDHTNGSSSEQDEHSTFNVLQV